MNVGDEDGKPVETLYIGNEDIKVAIEKLKAELSLARLDTNQAVNDGKGIEETIKANQVETSSKDDEIIVLEHRENELSMDCWSDAQKKKHNKN